MKNLVCLIVFCVLGSFANAQNNEKERAIINEIIDTRNINDSISLDEMLSARNIPHGPARNHKKFYQDSVGRYAISFMREGMESYKDAFFYGYRNDSLIYIDSLGNRSMISRHALNKLDTRRRWRSEQIVADSMLITEEKRAYINAQIDKMERHTWGEGLLNNATLIWTDTVTKIFKDAKHPWRGTIPKKELNKKLGFYDDVGYHESYTISVPIFLRNDTYCFLYLGGSYGWGEFAIYRKVNGKWEHWSSLRAWVS